MDVSIAKRRRSSRSTWSQAATPRRRRSSGAAYYPRAHAVTDPVLIAAAHKANGPGKRLFDIVAAFLGLALLSPVLLTVGLLIWLQDRGPILYGHTRVGRTGKHFRCWKLRSMVRNSAEVLEAHLAADENARREWEATQKLTDDPRVTALGRFIRKTSLDELPQLWNVLVGEMSIVGPRPITRPELDRYGKDRRYYLLVRPGITGLWQVSGRNNTTYERRIALDRSYLENWSYVQDLFILARTPLAVLRSEGAS